MSQFEVLQERSIIEIKTHEDKTEKLYEASMRGCVATLNLLLEKDPFLLDRISLTFFSETPLHISSLLGHVDFTRALLNRKPKLAAEQDSQGQSPLHLASAEGHIEIVEALLSVNTDLCLVSDKHGRIPLHLAAMRGRFNVIQQLINACPESVQIKLLEEETVLHLCVRYNHLECLKLLVTYLHDDVELLNSTDREGNTIFHLAAIMKQVETIKYLVTVPEVRVEAEAKDVIFKTLLSDFKTMPMPIQDCICKKSTTPKLQKKTSCNMWNQYIENQRKWLKETRGNLMIVATVIAAMAFQAAINPPGELWENEFQNKECKTEMLREVIKNKTIIGAKKLALNCIDEFNSYEFIICNTVSFSASLSIILLLIALPLKNQCVVWIMLIQMCVSVIFVAMTYVISISLVEGSNKDRKKETFNDVILFYYLLFWIGLLLVIVVVVAIWLLHGLVTGISCATKYLWVEKQPQKLKAKEKSAGCV